VNGGSNKKGARLYSLNTNTFTFSLDILKDPGVSPARFPDLEKSSFHTLNISLLGNFCYSKIFNLSGLYLF
jgi:hypothetical protein